MSGSKRWFGYTSGAGQNFAVQLDESIYESPGLGFGPVTDGNSLPISATGSLPFSLRKVNCYIISGTDTLRKSFYVGTEAALAALAVAGFVTVEGVDWNVSSVSGEVVKVVPPYDTEQLDGDVDDNFSP